LRAAIGSLIGLLCLTLTGCGPSDAVWVTFDVVKGGQPLVAPENQSVQVTFYGIERKTPVPGENFGGQPFMARLTGPAKYEVPGPDGYGIPAGKYKVSVIQKPKTGTMKAAPAKGRRPPKAPDRDEDFLKNQFGPDSSPILRTIEKSSHLTIDLDKPSE
jgi:hypothetical protein